MFNTKEMKTKKKKTKKIDMLSVNPVYVGDRPASEMDLSIISYDSKKGQIKKLFTVDELAKNKDDSKISWVNINGLKDVASIKKIGELYNIHPLTIEDILNTEQQPKVEIFDTYKYLSIKTIQRGNTFQHAQKKVKTIFQKKRKQQDETAEFMIDQVSIIIMNDCIITFQEIAGDSFDGIRKRILDDAGEIRKTGIDYLCYAILDSIVDEYSLTLSNLEEDIENFEDRATKTSDDTFIEEIQDTKKYLSQIKRAIMPTRDNLAIITRHEVLFQSDVLTPFFQDLNEHLHNAIITVDNYREWLTNIMDVNLSVVSHQMNKVMKVLATISTIFIPLTFIAGVYGMNFRFMPELEYELAYPITLGCMGLIAGIMIIIFKIRHWF